MGISDFRSILSIADGRFVSSFFRKGLFLLLVFCFVPVFFAGPVRAAESTWQTVVGEGNTGTSLPGTTPFITSPAPFLTSHPSSGIKIRSHPVKDTSVPHSKIGVIVISVVPGAELQAGERAIIKLKLEGSLGYVGGVDIEIDGKGPYPAKDEEIQGVYFCYWNIPKTPGKRVNIVSRVHSLSSNKVLALYSKWITIKPAPVKDEHYNWYGVIPVNPGALLQAGERATIELKVQGSVAHIGRVDIEIDGKVCGVAGNPSRGHYVFYWKIPLNCAKQVEIVWRTHPPTDDGVVSTHTDTFTIHPAAMPFEAVWKEFFPGQLRLGDSKNVVVEVANGTAPYTYLWKINYNNKMLRSFQTSHDKKSCEYEIGPFDDPKMIGNDIEIEVEIRDLEGESRSLKDTIYVPSPELSAYFTTAPGKLEVGKNGSWTIKCYNNDLDRISVTVSCGDNTPKPAVKCWNLGSYILLEFGHTYMSAGTYIIDITIMQMDGEGTIVRLKKEVKIIPVKLTIVEFIGPEKARVNNWSTFKVKIKPHSNSKPPYKYKFYFGDNSIGYESGDFVEVEKNHYYKAAKIYPVRVQVEDSSGSYNESNIQVTVTE